MSTTRPLSVDAGPHTTDDGLFGPDSVTWKAMAHPSTGIGAATAAMVQMLYPPVMYVIDQSSNVRANPDLRAQRTAQYATTITYGDVASADAAGAALRRIHARCTASHPDTGAALAADDPDLLVWVHNALTWSLLRTWDLYGADLSAAERDQFVVEQREAARLVGCDPDRVGGSAAEVDAAMAAMGPRLALSAPAVWFREMVTAQPDEADLGTRATKWLMTQGAIAAMGPEHRGLYGFTWSSRREQVMVGLTRALLATVEAKMPFDVVIPQLRTMVDEQAFGSRRRVEVPRAEPG
ncbi:oxygenase MpaB family protein [Rhabdothermincola salaria]|uniref:oxygenase MpaB family protein n=1 Tax=Rhabdothermincola salaria TaxID=2903142 RepID=UPI001E33741C|nr:oxygenase MpaB family protein [Rhabdothermincola salaria]MCD9623191.1 DUF2236 domain-containing protein [Rhabdothermincola salaria]